MKRLCTLFLLLIALSSTVYGQWRGEVISDTFSASSIYPGTVHRYWLYIPEQYDAKSPACLYVGLDGICYDAPAVMDSLIASGEMPMTIGLFVEAGKIYDADGSVVRYNRSNEFDATDGRFATFLIEELLPHAMSHTTAKGLTISISDKADDHAIAGSSSGGIASFSAAWFRPDLFRRVFTTIGTFVAMRGGNELPALVRKTEPLPLRIFIHDGEKDVWNPVFGHWYEYNQLIASAMEFAGYDYRAYWDDCGHSSETATRIFADVMRFLWQGYPEQIGVGKSSNDTMPSVIIDGQQWQPYDGEFPTPAPQTAISPDGKILVEAEPMSDWLISYTLDAEGQKSNGQQFYWLHNPSHRYDDVVGMVFATDGHLYVATRSGIQVCDHNGRVRVILRSPSVEIEAFAFEGNTIYIKAGAKSYCREVRGEAHALSAPRIAYRKQGEG